MTTWQLFIAQAMSRRMIKCEYEECQIHFPFDRHNPKKRFCCPDHKYAQVRLNKRMEWHLRAEAKR